MEIKEEEERRKNSKETRAHLEAMVLQTKPEANKWLHLTPQIAALGTEAFQRGPAIITKIHAYLYLVKEVNLAENAEEKSAEFVNRVCQVTLEAFWTQIVKEEEGFDRTDSMLEGLGAGWTKSFPPKSLPLALSILDQKVPPSSHRVINRGNTSPVRDVGAENFVRGPVVLLTEGVENLRLDGILTLVAITHGNLGGLMNLTRYTERVRENLRRFDLKEQERMRQLIEKEENVRRHAEGMPLLTDLSLAIRTTDPLALIRGAREFVTVIYGPAVMFMFPDIKVEAYRRSV